ncbi:MAG: hypothetical protein APF77_01615 [Clostridia bacterium BRH_c25]|nr:MAG: hypothetical protein APF77_01615 [Clostridia bacterium BRH_c25]
MPKWTYKITIANRLDRDLELISKSVPWGQEKSFPNLIKKGEVDNFEVDSGAGTMTGIEFYATLQDKLPDAASAHYGMVNIKVDIPYWKAKNATSCEGTGLLKVDNFTEIPDKAHDYSTTVTVSKKTL